MYEVIEQLGIRFGDNDFQTTFQYALKLYAQRLADAEYFTRWPLTKAMIVKELNLLLYPVYEVFQNSMHSFEVEAEDYAEHTKRYLTIREDMVYVNDELTEFFEKYPGGYNGEVFCIQMKRFIPKDQKDNWYSKVPETEYQYMSY